MNKNLIIAAVVVVVLLGGFVAYRQTKGKSEGARHDEKLLAVLLKNAKANDKAGLPDMARAIKAYHKDAKAYPPGLQALYPKYIPLKAFIDEINWSYQGRGDGFTLSKSVDVRGRTMVASIDQDMKISSTGGTRVAVGPAAPQGGGVAAPTLTLEQVLKPLEMAPRTDPASAQGSGGPPPVAVRSEPRTVEADAALDPWGLAGRTSRDLLVWRKADGSLGFGNVQYPQAERLYIALSDRWYRVSHGAAMPAVATASAQLPETAADGQMPTSFVRTVGSQMLVWRIDDGSIGFGNVQYPQQTPIQIAGPTGWDAFKGTAAPPPRPMAPAKPAAKPAAADSEPSALGLSEGYLAWKDKNGVIGFGNVQYPGNDVAFIHANGRWEKATN